MLYVLQKQNLRLAVPLHFKNIYKKKVVKFQGLKKTHIEKKEYFEENV